MLSSRDEEIARRFAGHIGLGTISGPHDHSPEGHVWRWTLTHPAAIRLFYQRLGPWLGPRRTATFAEALEDLARQGG